MAHERKRLININNLSIEEAESLSSQIGDKVREISDEATNKINDLLNIYGMKAKFSLVIEENSSAGQS